MSKLIKQGFSEASQINNKDFKKLKDKAIGTFDRLEFNSVQLCQRLSSIISSGRSLDEHYNYEDYVNRITLPQFRRAASVPYFGQAVISSK